MELQTRAPAVRAQREPSSQPFVPPQSEPGRGLRAGLGLGPLRRRYFLNSDRGSSSTDRTARRTLYCPYRTVRLGKMSGVVWPSCPKRQAGGVDATSLANECPSGKADHLIPLPPFTKRLPRKTTQ